MPESILLQLHRRQAEAVEEAWNAASQEATAADEVDQILEAAVPLVKGLRQTWDATFKGLSNKVLPLTEVQETRRALLALFDRVIGLLQQLREGGQKYESSGYAMRSLPALAISLSEAVALRNRIFAFWAEFTPEDAQQAREAIRRGECQDLDDAFAEIAGVDKAEWLRRVEAHKAAKAASGNG
jgi:hypothetical protein